MRRNTLLCFVVAILLSTSIGWAQDEDKTVYFHAGNWDVPRDKWDDFRAYFEKYEKAHLEQMVADGVLVEWGFHATSLHSPDGYSHGVWMGAHSIADIYKALDGFYAALGDNADEAEAELASLITKHEDNISRTIHYDTRSSKFSNGYLIGRSIRVNRGHGREYRQAWEDWVLPVYEKLLAAGTIVGYSLETQYYHTDAPGEWHTWYILEDMAADEKVSAAFDAAGEGLSESDRNAQRHFWMGIIEPGSHRDYLERIIDFQSK